MYDIIIIEREVKFMGDEIFNPCKNCPYDDNGWCCCGGELPDDALCVQEYE